MLKKNN